HISNRHMELERVVAAIGAAERLVTYIGRDEHKPASSDYKFSAVVAALARNPGYLGDLPQRQGWTEVKPDPQVPAWTDDYPDIVAATVRKKFETCGAAGAPGGPRATSRALRQPRPAAPAIGRRRRSGARDGAIVRFSRRQRNAPARPASRATPRPGRQYR